jgi:hypothetical protein
MIFTAIMRTYLHFKCFAKTAKNTYQLRRVYLSVHMKQLGPYWMDFGDSTYWGVLLKSVNMIQFWLKCDENNRHYTKINMSFILKYLTLPSFPMTTENWGCHGHKAMDISFINYTAVHELNKRRQHNFTNYIYDVTYSSSPRLLVIYVVFTNESLTINIMLRTFPFIGFTNLNSKRNE